MLQSSEFLNSLFKRSYVDNSENNLRQLNKSPFLQTIDDESGLTIRYVGRQLSHQDAATIGSDKIITRNQIAFYYEVAVKQCKRNQNFSVGFAEENYPQSKLPGFFNNSIGVQWSGKIVQNKKQDESANKYLKVDDVIGVGINFLSKKMFYCLNSKLIREDIVLDILNKDLIAVFGLQGTDVQLGINFGKEEFKFDLNEYLKKKQSENFYNIQKGSVEVSKVYELVTQYLQFNCYHSTLKEINKEQDIRTSQQSIEQTDEANRQEIINEKQEQKDENRKILLQQIKQRDIFAAQKTMKNHFNQLFCLNHVKTIFYAMRFIQILETQNENEALKFSHQAFFKNRIKLIKNYKNMQVKMEDLMVLLVQPNCKFEFLKAQEQFDFMANYINKKILKQMNCLESVLKQNILVNRKLQKNQLDLGIKIDL